MAKYLRLTIDVRVENDEFALDLLGGEVNAHDLQQNIEAGEVAIDGYDDVKDFGDAS